MLDQIRKMINQARNYFCLRIELLVTLLIFLAWYSLNLKGGFHVDEVTYASAGQSIMHGAFYVNIEHPPLAKYFIGLGEMVVGETSFGARFPPVIFAVATLLLVYEIIRLFAVPHG
jgi:predicted membrane-bound dolichyl-phosphate-mannose-protein mannosyltransferase